MTEDPKDQGPRGNSTIIDAIVEEFIGQHQAGHAVDPVVFAGEVAPSIRDEILSRCMAYLANLTAFRSPERSRPPSSKPVRIGGYRVFEQIGVGGMATVYRAVDERSGAERALKILHPHLAASLASVKRFQREFEVGSGLEHPHLVGVVEQGEEGGDHFIVMSRVLVASVADYLKSDDEGEELRRVPGSELRGAARFQHAASICRDVCSALEYIHGEGVIHRDIKPHNVLLDDRGRAYLADLGLARIHDELSLSLTRTGQLVGTPYYMSPEQVRARKYGVDERTDIFSLGALLYEVIAGRVPFDGDSEEKVLYAISFADAKPPRAYDPTIPEDLETICLKALEKVPGHRYPSASAMRADLARFERTEGISARPPNRWLRVARRVMRHRSKLFLGLFVFALSAATGKVVVDHRRRSADERGMQSELTVITSLPGADVWAQKLDARSGDFGKARHVGFTPLIRTRVDPGFFRVVVSNQLGQFAELTRWFNEKQRVELRPSLRDTNGIVRGMISIPAGRFIAGMHETNKLYPSEEVELDAFFVDAHETTMAEYKEFLDAHPNVPWPSQWGGRYDPAWGSLPATGMRWDEARRYAEYRGKRLLTRRERLRVARGVTGRDTLDGLEGDRWVGNTAVALGSGAIGQETESRFRSFLALVPPVGSYPLDQTPEGVYDVLGGVAEWIDGVGINLYQGTILPEWGQRHAVGNAWNESYKPDLATITTFPAGVDPALSYVGIRCGRSQGPPRP